MTKKSSLKAQRSKLDSLRPNDDFQCNSTPRLLLSGQKSTPRGPKIDSTMPTMIDSQWSKIDILKRKIEPQRTKTYLHSQKMETQRPKINFYKISHVIWSNFGRKVENLAKISNVIRYSFKCPFKFDQNLRRHKNRLSACLLSTFIYP